MPRRRSDHAVLAWWGALGLGLGLLVLALVIGLQKARLAWEANPLWSHAHQVAPLIAQLRQGHAPSPDMVKQAEGTVLANLLQTLVDADRQRRQALLAYQTQVEAVALGSWLTPAKLVNVQGRAQVKLRLDELRAALDELVRRDAAVQSRLDEALLAWLQQWPGLQEWPWRRDLLASTGSTAQATAAFCRVEQDLVTRVEALLGQLNHVGRGVTLEGSAATQELVFARQDDLAFYRATLSDLNDLGHREQQGLVAAEQASGQHARELGDLLAAALEQAR